MKTLLTTTLILCGMLGYAQKEANIWYFGNKAGLDFNYGKPVALTNGAMNTPYGCASICDPVTGNLLFYTNGRGVWDANHYNMAAGSVMNADTTISQPVMIIPIPETPSKYYIFYHSIQDSILFQIVDMTLNSGKGGLLYPNAVSHISAQGFVADWRMTAVKHANGKDIWFITHDRTSDEFYAFKISSTGISAPVISKVGWTSQGGPNFSLKASPDGKYIAGTNSYHVISLFDFDNTNGKLSNPVTDIPAYTTGVAFSSDNSKLYALSQFGLIQYDLSVDSLKGKTVIYNNNFYIPSTLQLGTDGKIYLAWKDSSFLSIIDQPNNAGTACSFKLKGVSLNGKLLCGQGLPNFIESYFNSSPQCSSNCVWPGDANNSGTANVWDLLNIGIGYGAAGNSRTPATNQTDWIGHSATDWSKQFMGGLNYKYADCDGNGTIELNDAAVILMNYGQTHSKTNAPAAANNAPLLSFGITVDSIGAGQTLTVPIHLGSAQQPADSVYGIAFTVNYDADLVDSVRIDFSNSWLGMLNTEILAISKEFRSNGQLDIAITRINHKNKSGSGPIAQLNVVMVENIAGKTAGNLLLPFSVSNIKTINALEQDIPVNAIDTSIKVYQTITGISNAKNQQRITAYPNPAQGIIHVDLGEHTHATVSLVNVVGQTLVELNTGEQKVISLNTEGYIPGIYHLNVVSEKGVYSQRITLTK